MIKKSIISQMLRPSSLLLIFTILFFIPGISNMCLKSLFVVALSLIGFYIGELLSKRFNPQLNMSNQSLFYFGATLFVLSLLSLYLNFFTAGGFPIFNPALRRFLSPGLTYLSFLMVPATLFIISSLSKNKKILSVVLILFTTSMMALLGFRTEVLAILIGGAVTLYYLKIFSHKELLLLLLFAVLSFAGMSIVRPGGLGLTRSITTTSAFDFLISVTPWSGLTHGYVEFADFIKFISKIPIYGGRTLVSSIIGSRTSVSTTSTLFGPPFADFGLFSVLIFIYFGLVVGAGFKSKSKQGIYTPMYAVLLTFLLLGIETGIVDLVVWVYFIFASILYLISHNYES